MSGRTMWFGPAGNLKQIKMPQGGGSHSSVGYSESIQYLSGRKAIRRSTGSHKEYDWTWRGTRAEIQHLLDCADGIAGEPPFYFIDPMWARDNILPQHWAAPVLGALDAPSIYGDTRPEAVPMQAADASWPSRGAAFRRQPGAVVHEVRLPLVPNRVLLIWASFTIEGSLQYALANGVSTSTWENLPISDPLLPLVGQATPALSGSSGYDTVRLRVNIPGTAPSATIYGIRAVSVSQAEAELIQAGSVPEGFAPGFVGGRGHSGVDFEQFPTVTPYSVPYDSIGVSARLVEVDY